MTPTLRPVLMLIRARSSGTLARWRIEHVPCSRRSGIKGVRVRILRFIFVGICIWGVGVQLFSAVRDNSAVNTDRLERQTESRGERQARLESLGLAQRYEVHSLIGNRRDALFVEQDFEQIEAWLESLYAQSDDPYLAHNYYRSMFKLIEIRHGLSPEAMDGVLKAWIARDPEAYRPHFLRGRFLIEYGWHVSPLPYGKKVRFKANELFLEAEAELALAEEANKDDPNAAAAQVIVALGLRRGMASVDAAFQRAIEADQDNLIARYNRLHAVLPKCGGSWEAVDEAVEEAKRASVAFPMLNIMARYSAFEMQTRGRSYVDFHDSWETQVSFAHPYMGQLDRNEGDLILLCNAARYASKGREFALAESFFSEIGDRFYIDSNFKDLMEFNDYRAWTHAKVARTQEEPLRSELLERALEIAPTHYYTNYAMGVEKLAAADLDSADTHLTRSQERNPDYGPVYVGLAELAQRKGDTNGAEVYARRALKQGVSGVLEAQAREILDN